MEIFEFQIAGIKGLAQLDIVVRHIAIVIAFVYDKLPVTAIV